MCVPLITRGWNSVRCMYWNQLRQLAKTGWSDSTQMSGKKRGEMTGGRMAAKWVAQKAEMMAVWMAGLKAARKGRMWSGWGLV